MSVYKKVIADAENEKVNTTNINKNIISIILILFMTALLSACSTVQNIYNTDNDVSAITAHRELSDKELLDISIKIFDTEKLPSDKEDRRGLSEEIRNAEARYMPIHLKYTMQRTGYWGNVRVVPDKNEGSEILVTGTIVESDGESIKLKIKVVDSRNITWFEKTYQQTVTIDDRKRTEPQKEDNFQGLYNNISNDIIKYRKKLELSEVERIRQVSQIRFAQLMAPETFSYYLATNQSGQYELTRLPSSDDPMIKRIHSIKARDELLTDTINNYYDIYYTDMWDSYDNWRKFRSEEMDTLREIERKALTQKIIGAAAIIGAIALGASSNAEVRDRTGVLRTVMIAGGGYALYSGFQTSKETEINKEAIEELGASFSTEIEPIVVEVKEKNMELTGSAEQQYSKWRNLLKEIYQKETGFN